MWGPGFWISDFRFGLYRALGIRVSVLELQVNVWDSGDSGWGFRVWANFGLRLWGSGLDDEWFGAFGWK